MSNRSKMKDLFLLIDEWESAKDKVVDKIEEYLVDDSFPESDKRNLIVALRKMK